MNIKWLYERDYKSEVLYALCWYWKELGYKVYVSGYSIGEVREG